MRAAGEIKSMQVNLVWGLVASLENPPSFIMLLTGDKKRISLSEQYTWPECPWGDLKSDIYIYIYISRPLSPSVISLFPSFSPSILHLLIITWSSGFLNHLWYNIQEVLLLSVIYFQNYTDSRCHLEIQIGIKLASFGIRSVGVILDSCLHFQIESCLPFYNRMT